MRQHTAALASGTSTSWRTVGPNDQICVAGTFDDALVQLSASPDGGTTWVPLFDVPTIESSTWVSLTLPPGTLVRAEIVNAGASTSINVWVP